MLSGLLFGFKARWGFKAHTFIARSSIIRLPSELREFYKTNLSGFEQAVLNPDIRRYNSPEEKPRHYIDLDDYTQEAQTQLRYGWDSAVSVLGEDTLMQYGILPFAIIETKVMLTRAMQERAFANVLRYSADLVHYVSDAHVPLHTTGNYNGQRTGQRGIHALWETRIPELELTQYDLWLESPRYIPHITSWTWGIIDRSHEKVDSVLAIESRLTQQIPEDQKYAHQQRGMSLQRAVSESFARRYSSELNGMVERRLTAAITECANILFTCWVDAGQPDLSGTHQVETKKSIEASPEDDHHK